MSKRSLTWFAVALVWFGAATIPARGITRDEAIGSSSVVFIGTVTKVGQASLDAIPESVRNVVVVRVVELLEAAEGIPLAKDDLITVEVKDLSLFHENLRATFYTQGWIVGKGLAVREIHHEPSLTGSVELTKEGVRIIRETLKENALRDKVKGSLVCLGAVREVRSAPREGRPWSEHDPDWQEAVIRVRVPALNGSIPNLDIGLGTMKGQPSGVNILVRFPKSTEGAWYRTPKLVVNQRALLILRPLNGRQGVYTALDPEDVQLPTQEAVRRIVALLRH